MLPDYVLSLDKRPPRAQGQPHTQTLWICDLRTNGHFTRKKNPLATADLQDNVIPAEIVENLQAALEAFQAVAEELTPVR